MKVKVKSKKIKRPPASVHRCAWCGTDPLYVKYHDSEWGVALHNDRKLFELLNLEGAQAGLSWITILRKRQEYRKAFDRFDPEKIIRYDRRRIGELMKNAGIVRNRLKIEGVIKNANAFLAVKKEFGNFDSYIWQFTGGKTIRNNPKSLGEIPATTPESDAMGKDLKKRGFTFVGSTICYAFMQSAGMVDDHVEGCFRKR
jgi:DNA-3-methyladenine glycosylase I